MAVEKQDMLQGWKDIATYMDRDVRTVRRWEKQRGLPVRRIPGGGRANVYVLVAELDLWLSQVPEIDSLPDATAESLNDFNPDPQALVPPGDPLLEPSDTLVRRPSRSWIIASALGAIAVLAIVFTTLDLRAHHQRQRAEAAHHSHYISSVPGVDDLYLRGVYSYSKRTPASLAAAEQSLQQAVAKDPKDAPAWSALAITHNLMRQYGSMPSAVGYERARVESQKAIDLDPSLSDAHASLGFVQFFWDWNVASADHQFQTAISLDPNSALAHQWYGSMLVHEGFFPQATEQLDIAQHIEPNSSAILTVRAIALAFGGHRPQAVELLQQITTQDPNYSTAHAQLGLLSLLSPHDIPSYLAERRSFAVLMVHPNETALIDAMELAYRGHGNPPQHDEPAMWRLLLQSEQADRHLMGIARAEAQLGHTDAAFADLQKMLPSHDDELIGINLIPDFDPLRHDHRYNQLLATMGLPSHP